jgi:hypothetical protein
MSGHSHHLPSRYANLAPWELAADAVAALPEADGALKDGSNLYLAAETVAHYWAAQADLLRLGALLHTEAQEARSRYEQSGSVSEAYEAARSGQEAAERIGRLLREAGNSLKEAAADVLLVEAGMDPLTAEAMRERTTVGYDPSDL